MYELRQLFQKRIHRLTVMGLGAGTEKEIMDAFDAAVKEHEDQQRREMARRGLIRAA